MKHKNEARNIRKNIENCFIHKSRTRPPIWMKSGSKFLYWSGSQASTKKITNSAKTVFDLLFELKLLCCLLNIKPLAYIDRVQLKLPPIKNTSSNNSLHIFHPFSCYP